MILLSLLGTICRQFTNMVGLYYLYTVCGLISVCLKGAPGFYEVIGEQKTARLPSFIPFSVDLGEISWQE